MHRRRRDSFFLCIAIGSIACGDDDPESRVRDAGSGGSDASAERDAAPPPESGVAAELRLTELSAEDAAKVCGAFAARLDRLLPKRDYLEVSCTLQAWPVSLDVSNITGEYIGNPRRCKELRGDCIAQDGALGEFSAAQSIGADLVDVARCVSVQRGADPADCEATVVDFEACAYAAVADLGPRLARADCDALSEPDALERVAPEVDLTAIEACQPLRTRCPDLSIETLLDGKAPGSSAP